METNPPPLAQYKPLVEYVPAYGDYITWSGWFSTWHGLITNYVQEEDELHAIFGGVPYLLFTMPASDHKKETRKLKLDYIKRSPNGKFAIQKYEQSESGPGVVWYI